jgi:hypothetical protein
MKHKNFSLFGVLAVALIAIAFGLAPTVQATTTNLALGYGYQAPAVPNAPATIAASATATNTAVIDVRNFDVAYIQLTATLANTNVNTATLSIPVHRSFDGTTFESTATTTLLLTYSGVNTITWGTNMNLGGAGYLKFNQYVNSATNIATISGFNVCGKQPIRVPFTGGVPTTAAGSR